MRYIQIYPTLPLYINFGPHLNRPEYQSSKVEHTSKLQKSKLRWFRPCLNIGHIVCYGMFPTRLSLVDFAKIKITLMRCTRGGRNTGTNCKDSLKKWVNWHFTEISKNSWWHFLVRVTQIQASKGFWRPNDFQTSSFFSRKRE